MSRLRGFFPGFVLFLYLMRNILAATLLLLLTTSCARQVVKPPVEPPVTPPAVPATEEAATDLERLGPLMEACDWKGFFEAVDTVLPALEKNPGRIFVVGETSFNAESLALALRDLRKLGSEGKTPAELREAFSSSFEMMELSSINEKAFFTAYYVPEFEARSNPEGPFRYPIYSPPPDLLQVRLFPLGPDFRRVIFRGRIDEKNRLVPYYDREKIDGKKVLSDKGLEIAYLKDPLEVLILQIQGSGRLVFEDGSIKLAAYAGKNGLPYMSIGKYMAEKEMLPPEEVSWANIRSFLENNPGKLEEVLYSNPSYVFFRIKEAGQVVGSLGLPLTPFHSIAVDESHIPPLSLCLIDLRKPVIGEDGLVKSFAPLVEPVFAMDEGSAIKGPARVDIFLGSGAGPEKLAGTLKSEGSLYLLVPRRQ